MVESRPLKSNAKVVRKALQDVHRANRAHRAVGGLLAVDRHKIGQRFWENLWGFLNSRIIWTVKPLGFFQTVSIHTQTLSEHPLELTHTIRGIHKHRGTQNRKIVKDSERIFGVFWQNSYPPKYQITGSVPNELKLCHTHHWDTLNPELFTVSKLVEAITSYSESSVGLYWIFGSKIQIIFSNSCLRRLNRLKFTTLTNFGVGNTNLGSDLSLVNVKGCCLGHSIFGVFSLFRPY